MRSAASRVELGGDVDALCVNLFLHNVYNQVVSKTEMLVPLLD